MTRFNPITTCCILFSAFLLNGCGESTQTGSAPATVAPSWVLTSAPAGAVAITDAKASATEGDEIIIRGRIGGRKEPLTEGSAVFTVVDLALPHCAQNPDDKCRTPWDYCCETQDTISANAATVQIVDESGRPISHSPAQHGFSALDEVIVVGVVAPRPNEQVLTVRATGLYRVGG